MNERVVESKMEREWRERDGMREDFQSTLFWPSAGTGWPLTQAAVRLWEANV